MLSGLAVAMETANQAWVARVQLRPLPMGKRRVPAALIDVLMTSHDWLHQIFFILWPVAPSLEIFTQN